MRKDDVFFVAALVVLTSLLVLPWTGRPFFAFSEDFPLMGGFIKFFILASIGDLLSRRIANKDYRVEGLFYKAFVWGFIGVVIALVFPIYDRGVDYLQSEKILPFEGIQFFSALFTSVLMNVTFAPTMMYFHRISDHYIESKKKARSHRLAATLSSIDTPAFIRFVVFKTIPFFWIPAHTITFLLPQTYRVLFASLLGIALGLLLGIAKRATSQKEA